MAKQPFTPAGVQAKLTALYALADINLQEQATAIRSDFKLWITENFNLDASQTTYLNGIDQRFLLQAGSLTATAVGGRLPVSLVFPTPPGGYSSKYIIIADHLTPRSDSVDGYTVTGALQFTIGYVI